VRRDGDRAEIDVANLLTVLPVAVLIGG